MRVALWAGHGDDAHLFVVVQLCGFRHHVELVANMAAQQRVVGRGAALKRHMVQADAGRLLHQHPHEVRQRARTRRPVTGVGRIGFGFGQHVGHGLHIRRRARDQAELKARDL